MAFTKNAVDTTLVGQTGTGEFVGSNSPSLVTPSLGNASCTDLTVTGAGSLPTADGTMGQVMSTDGSGTWFFADATAGTITGATNLGGGTPTYISTSGTDLQFGTYAAGTNINFSTVGDLTTISATGSGMTFTYEQALWVSQNNGADMDAGTSIDTPLLTLQAAITMAGTTPTVIYLVDGFVNNETVTTSGAGQTIYISAPGTTLNGTYANLAMDNIYIDAPSVSGVTNSGFASIIAQTAIGITSTGAGSQTYIDVAVLNGLTLADSTDVILLCSQSAGSITNDSTGTLNGTVGGTLPGLTGDQQISGRITADSIAFIPTTHGVVGTTAADNAASGYVGQFISSVVSNGSPVSIASNTDTNLTSISLTAGDWDVYGNVDMLGSMQQGTCWISTSSATTPDRSLFNGLNISSGPVFGAIALSAPYKRVNVNTTTTVYISARCTITTGSVTMTGGIYARRAR